QVSPGTAPERLRTALLLPGVLMLRTVTGAGCGVAVGLGLRGGADPLPPPNGGGAGRAEALASGAALAAGGTLGSSEGLAGGASMAGGVEACVRDNAELASSGTLFKATIGCGASAS